ncbi:MAG TPA: deoxyguanosinetriphosphate triphosphohydrolase [Anaerolineae bacterium]|jgi:dGTPase|nr:deoxyguanosinetriphosphate triphosphohydrolase [Anaerolineae bacterium]
MIFNRQHMEDFEEQTLAPYGMRSRNSRGRVYPEQEHPYRTAYQRDRDRIIHTTAFRRLEYKTQVFVVTEGDYYRTRLTHTLEVAQIGRTLARALGANEDLAETICLVHDIGHPPFGHSGEQALNQLMKDHGGFDHNQQALRIVQYLEQRYPEWPGLNLTYETREGIVKHETEYDTQSYAEEFEPHKRGLLEAQIANAADEIAYNAHDLDDGLRAGLFTPADLDQLELWQQLKHSVGWDGREFNDVWRHRLIRRLIGLEVTDVVNATDERLTAAKIISIEDLQKQPKNVIGFSDELKQINRGLKDFLFKQMYRHYRVTRMQIKADRLLSELFTAYVGEPGQMPEAARKRIDQDGLQRAVCNYLGGMTDRFALDEHAKMFDPQVRV